MKLIYGISSLENDCLQWKRQQTIIFGVFQKKFPLYKSMKTSSFKQFLNESITSDTKEIIAKLPKCCKSLLKDYKFKFQGGNTLKGDNDHIGENDLEKKKITIAAPWEYARSFTVLHEIGHLFWKKYIENNERKKKEWHKLTRKNKDKIKQNDEELFCHAFANHFAKHKVLTHDNDNWDKFIEKEIKEAS